MKQHWEPIRFHCLLIGPELSVKVRSPLAIPKRASPLSVLNGREELSPCLSPEAASVPEDSNGFHLNDVR